MSYLRKASLDSAPSNLYIALAADPSIAMFRSAITVAGIAADAPHICGGPLLLLPTLIRQNEFHQMKESGVALSIWFLTIESFNPPTGSDQCGLVLLATASALALIRL